MPVALTSQSTAVSAALALFLPAGILWLKGMNWFPFLRPFLDPTPLEEQLSNRISDHNAAIKMTREFLIHDQFCIILMR